MVIQQFFFIILHAGCKGQFCAVLVRMATNFAGSRISFSHDRLGKSGVLIKVDGVFCLS